MKRFLPLYFVLVTVLFSCKTEKENEGKSVAKTYASFGDKITAEAVITKDVMTTKYDKMNVGDTLAVKFSSTINKVCQKKGCWIKVPLEGDKETFVKFKDYAFFMPMDAAGSKVILNGKAFKSEVSIAELKHYAKDEGKTEEEIAKITAPKITYSFIADGVLLATGK